MNRGEGHAGKTMSGLRGPNRSRWSHVLPLAGLLALGLLAGCTDSNPTPPDAADPEFTAKLLEQMDSSPSKFVNEFVGQLVSPDASHEQVGEVRLALLEELAPEAEIGAEDEALANALIRRLGPAALDYREARTMAADLQAMIDPDDLISGAGDIESIVGAWAATTSGTVLRITEAGAPGLSDMAFADGESYVQDAFDNTGFVDISIPAITGLPEMSIAGVDIIFGEDTITFAGTADVLDNTVDIIVVTQWAGESPQFVVGLELPDWSLADAGLAGPLADFGFNGVHLIASDAAILDSKLLAQPAYDFLAPSLGTEFEISLQTGINFAADLPLNALPEAVNDALNVGDAEVQLEGFLGVNFGLLSGEPDAGLDLMHLEAQLPAIATPRYDSYFEGDRNEGWLLNLHVEDGLTMAAQREYTMSVNGQDVQVLLEVQSSDGEDVAVSGFLIDPWDEPFGIEWLSIDELDMAIAGSGDALSVLVEAAATIAETPGTVVMQIPGHDGDVDITAALAEIDSEALLEILDAQTGVTLDADVLPDASLTKPTISVSFGETNTLSFTAQTEFLDVPAEFLIDTTFGSGKPDVLASFRLAEWSLGALGFDGPLADYTFPEIAFNFAQIQGDDMEVDSTQLTTAARSFFEPIYGDEFAFNVEAGFNIGADLPLSKLPSGFRDALELDSKSTVSLAGVVGLAFEPEPSLTHLALTAQLPAAEVAMPDWLHAVEGGWVLRFDYAGSQSSVGASRTFLADFGDDSVLFEMRVDASEADGGSTQITGQLLEPWSQPLGVEWLVLDEARLEIDSNDGGSATVVADMQIGDKIAKLTFAKDGEGSAIHGTLDSFSTADLTEFLARHFDVANLGDNIPDLEFNDIALDIQTGADRGIAFTALATVMDRSANVALAMVPDGERLAFVGGFQVEDWSLSNALPALEGSIADDLQIPVATLVVSQTNGEFASSELMPSMQQFFARANGEEEFTLELYEGITLAAMVPIGQGPMAQAMDVLGMAADTIHLRGTLPAGIMGGSGGSGGALDGLALAAQLPPMSPAGAPDWFVEGQLGFEIIGKPLTLGLEGSMTVRIGKAMDGDVPDPDAQELKFLVGAQFGREGVNYALSVYGGLEAVEPWEQPFGIEWLVVNDVAVVLSVNSAGSIGLGFAGDMVIGEKDIDAAVFVAINSATGIPTNFIFSAESAAGVSIEDLRMLRQDIAEAKGHEPSDIALDNLPSMAMQDIKVHLAAKENTVLGIERGFALAGTFLVEMDPGGGMTEFGTLDFNVNENGLYASGELMDYQLGPIAWKDILLDLTLTIPDQRLLFSGEATVFGINERIDVDLSKQSAFTAGPDARDKLNNIVGAWEDFTADAGNQMQSLRDLAAELDVAQDSFGFNLDEIDGKISELRPFLDDITGDQSVIDMVLGGVNLPVISNTEGTNGTIIEGEPRKCRGDPDGFSDDGKCWIKEPYAGKPGSYKPGCRIEIYEVYRGVGLCWDKPPSWTKDVGGYDTRANGNKYCKGAPVLWENRCYQAPPGAPNRGETTPIDICQDVRWGGGCYVKGHLPKAGTPGLVTPEIPDICIGVWQPLGGGDGAQCWLVPPIEGPIGGEPLGGLCHAKPELDLPCTQDEWVKGTIAPALMERLKERLNEWSIEVQDSGSMTLSMQADGDGVPNEHAPPTHGMLTAAGQFANASASLAALNAAYGDPASTHDADSGESMPAMGAGVFVMVALAVMWIRSRQ